MLVDSQKLKALRNSRNWTQQHLAEVCDLSMRTIQRVEKDGVASNETVAAYAAIFELEVGELLVTVNHFERRDRQVVTPPFMVAGLILASFIAGIVCTLWISSFY